MTTIRVEVFDQLQKAQQRRSQLELKGFDVSPPDEVADVVWDATTVTGRQDGAPDNPGTVWVVMARKK
jgi:hypothetical protein